MGVGHVDAGACRALSGRITRLPRRGSRCSGWAAQQLRTGMLFVVVLWGHCWMVVGRVDGWMSLFLIFQHTKGRHRNRLKQDRKFWGAETQEPVVRERFLRAEKVCEIEQSFPGIPTTIISNHYFINKDVETASNEVSHFFKVVKHRASNCFPFKLTRSS